MLVYPEWLLTHIYCILEATKFLLFAFFIKYWHESLAQQQQLPKQKEQCQQPVFLSLPSHLYFRTKGKRLLHSACFFWFVISSGEDEDSNTQDPLAICKEISMTNLPQPFYPLKPQTCVNSLLHCNEWLIILSRVEI